MNRSELERDDPAVDALRELARHASFPPTPDVWPVVAGRLDQRPRRIWWSPNSLPLAAAMAAAVLAGVLLVFPGLRAAIGHRLGVPGITIQLVDETPAGLLENEDVLLGLGKPVTLAAAQERMSFPLAIPTAPGWTEPSLVLLSYVADEPMVSFVYRPSATIPATSYREVGALLSQFSGETAMGLVRKGLVEETGLHRVVVAGHEGFWIDGEAHFFTFETANGTYTVEQIRLAGNTLIWTADGVTYRLESKLSQAAAIAVAESLAPGAAVPGTEAGAAE